MITIFTPIYNRAYIVENLYRSLVRQTSNNFEWLVIDDGSTDNISELVTQWTKNTNSFNIRFYRQKNQGKHYAINYGVKLAKYEAFFIVDSDDYLEDQAVETILKYWNEIDTDDNFAGISGLRRNESDKIIGDIPIFDNYIDATNLERSKFGLNGDKAEVYKTELLRKFPFPEYENEKFITEATVWDRIAYEGYKIRWINKSFIVCNYLEDGLTAKGEQLFLDNPKGWAHFIWTLKKYKGIKKQEFLKYCYYFYECENDKFTGDEIMRLLDLNDVEFETIRNQYTEFIQKLAEICKDKKISIYGYGKWGRRLEKYIERIGKRTEYVIDEAFAEIKEIKAYSIGMNLPQADIVFIALSRDAEKVRECIRKKMGETKVFLCKDIKPELW